MATFGFSTKDFDDTYEIWPDVWPGFVVFETMSTQWRAGACGATGLDYGVLPSVMRLCGVKAADRVGVFDDIRSMEAEALSVMSEARQSSP